MDVAAHLEEVFIFFRFDQKGLVSTLEKVPMQAVSAIVSDRVGALEPVHSRNQIRLGRLQKDVVMVSEQHECMNLPVRFPHTSPRQRTNSTRSTSSWTIGSRWSLRHMTWYTAFENPTRGLRGMPIV